MHEVEERVKILRKDLDKLYGIVLGLDKSHQRALDLLEKFIFQNNRRYDRMREQLEQTFGAVFPKHDRYLDEIERALKRARKRGS
jgi:hypothetical protein